MSHYPARMWAFSALIISAVLSGALLFLSFPKTNLFNLSWISLAPLLIAIKGRTVAAAGFAGLLSGAIFFLGMFDWILQVSGYTYLHHSLLAVYLGSYIGLFGLIFALISKRFNFTASLAAAPFFWTSIEYLRSSASFLALPWGLLAHSQYQHPVIIQMSSVFGLWGVSFLIVAVNAGIAGFVLFTVVWVKPKPSELGDPWSQSKELLAITAVALVFVSAALVCGYWKTSRIIEGQSLRLSIIQGNIEQNKKWDPAYAQYIMMKYRDLTMAASLWRPDLIVWPEAATPSSVKRNPKLNREVQALVSDASSPILFGSAQVLKFAKRKADGAGSHNSAFLFFPTQASMPIQSYDKIRLFPFGEYLPYKELIPWSWIDVADIGSYASGTEYKLFKINGESFATTICWENLFPDLVRQFVKKGARFIVNITNEARFGETAAPEQFLSMNVFRAVENGVYVVRCANTGISCFIDPCGRVVGRVKSKEEKDIFVSGFLTEEVVPISSGTFYTRYGDWFPWLCIVVSSGFILAAIFSRPDKKRSTMILNQDKIEDSS